jgi:hypothetical protein
MMISVGRDFPVSISQAVLGVEGNGSIILSRAEIAKNQFAIWFVLARSPVSVIFVSLTVISNHLRMNQAGRSGHA